MILRYDGGKWSYDKPASVAASSMNGIAMRQDGGEGWAVGDYATILHFQNGAWREHDAYSGDWLRALCMTGDFTAGFAVGHRGEIVRFTNGKWEFSPERKRVSVTLNDVWLKADGSEGWAVGERGEIMRFSGPGE